MDLHSFRRRQSLSKAIDQRPEEPFGVPERRFSLLGAMTITKILAIFLVIFPVLLVLVIFFGHDSYHQGNGFAEARVMVVKPEPNATFSDDQRVGLDKGFNQKQNAGPLVEGSEDLSKREEMSDEKKLLGGLLVSGFHEDSCLSRYQSFMYRKASIHKPSSYLLSKLRSYEELHRRCGPGSRPYAKAAAGLKHAGGSEAEGCKYVVLMSFSGLGNRIISIASAFLYAILTDRILLVEGGEQVSDLFCEPFPETSWLLPLDFPLLAQFSKFGQDSPDCYGNMLKRKLVNTSSVSPPSHLYLHLSHDYSDHDKMFFCQEDQSFLENVPWLIMRTNNYFVPSLFLIPSLENELEKLFPEKGTIFHLMGRYLFHPTNHVWGLVTRYYQAYLAKADERIGLQIRVFDEKSGVSPHVTRQIISCIQSEELLPKLTKREPFTTKPSENSKHKAVLVTSLTTGYSEILKSMYWENPTVTGDVIGVHQPSHEGHQQTEKLMHNRKAWAEMYLLSLTDKLVISAWSTFGYVAQGLGGLKAWILFKPENQTTMPDPPCAIAMSPDPCFHAPPYYECKAKKGIDTGNVVPHVRHCEDITWGLKLVDDS
ncbi:PREDICTED: fucosyltransferase 2 [Tarenaya hassleriana]|uniref:fucosyltransferase 2 n=1 Tax=Tarenaya hassleriana TaxID=28532 RepID=UPI00053C42AE|nr:PREDICTED: fucosyltransferase 2 [Tarenaya hassleriana]